ncbi:MAG: hypothetical protein ACPGH0_05845, partial [Opitutales bacterium]
MKKYLLAKKSLIAALMTGLMTATFISLSSTAVAQSASEKVRIMAEALRARDAGDLSLAKEKAEELIRLVPNDINAQRVLASINSEMERRDSGEALFGATTLPASATVADAGSVALAAQAEADRLAEEAAEAQEAERLAARAREKELKAQAEAERLAAKAREKELKAQAEAERLAA